MGLITAIGWRDWLRSAGRSASAVRKKCGWRVIAT
jgi:hypothetical protein